MATIVIRDLPESTQLDREAMLAIAGGSRLRTIAAAAVRSATRKVRLFDLAPARATRPPPR
jgi:hypothetical protein